MDSILGLTLFVTVFFGGVPARCMVDTGSPITLLSPASAAKIMTISPALDRTVMTGMGGGQFSLERHTVANIATGQLAWESGDVYVTTGPTAADAAESCIIGTNLLAQQDVILRWYSGRIELVPVVALSTNGS